MFHAPPSVTSSPWFPRGKFSAVGGLAMAWLPMAGLAAPLKHAGEPVKLTLAKISAHTLEVRLQRAGEETFVLPADATPPGLSREVLWQGTDLDTPLRLSF